MAVNKVVYGTTVLVDLTADTVTAATLMQGYTAHDRSGALITGTASGGGGDTYTRTVVVPQQTVTPNSSRMASFTFTEYFVDGEYYVVTYDGTEYIVTSETLWSNNVVLGDAQVVWTTSDVLYPFALITDGSAREGYFATTSQHTIKVERLEFVDGPLNLISKSITANGTYNASSDNADGYSSVTVNVPTGGGSPTLQSKTTTPTTSQQVIQPDSGYDGLSQVTVNAIPSQYIVPSGNKAITQNGTNIDVADYATVSVNVPTGGSSMNAQTAQSTTRATSSSYTEVISLTCDTAGTYDVYWTTFRTSTSGTWGSQLYLGNTAYGSAQTGSWSNNVQNIHLSNVSIAANQEVSVRVRTRGNGYYGYVGTLTIIQTA